MLVKGGRVSKIVGGIFMGIAVLIPVYFVVLAAVPHLIDSRYRTYWAFYQDIEVGMDRAEVKGLLAKHYPEDGNRLLPKTISDSESELGFFMNPEGSIHPNREGIFIDLEDDRVVGKRYSGD